MDMTSGMGGVSLDERERDIGRSICPPVDNIHAPIKKIHSAIKSMYISVARAAVIDEHEICRNIFKPAKRDSIQNKFDGRHGQKYERAIPKFEL
jgi:hypothetical protein